MRDYDKRRVLDFLRSEHHRYTSSQHGEPTSVWKAAADEIERLTDALTLIERVYYMEGKDAGWRAAHMNGVARTAQDGGNLTEVRRMFPRARKETSE